MQQLEKNECFIGNFLLEVHSAMIVCHAKSLNNFTNFELEVSLSK